MQREHLRVLRACRERYDIEAKVADVNFPASTSVGLPPLGEHALRGLLAERFNLKAHTETRLCPVYELVLHRADGKLGPALVRRELSGRDARIAAVPASPAAM